MPWYAWVPLWLIAIGVISLYGVMKKSYLEDIEEEIKERVNERLKNAWGFDDEDADETESEEGVQ